MRNRLRILSILYLATFSAAGGFFQSNTSQTTTAQRLLAESDATQPSHGARILHCLFIHEAAASQPVGVQVPTQWDIGKLIANAEDADTSEGSKAYARQLTEMFVSPLAGNLYIDTFAGRLSNADMTARHGGRDLVAESAIARAFNDLMGRIHSPLRTDVKVVHVLRNTLYAVSPALSTVNSNSSECLPSEAVDLMAQLVMRNGTLENSCSPSIPAEHRCVQRFSAAVLISRYTQSHSRSRNAELFDHAAKLFGI